MIKSHLKASVLASSFLISSGARATLPAGWTADAHPSATITMASDHAVSITSPNNVHAHIERDFNHATPVRVSAAIRSPEVADWAPSLFLYWQPGTWLRIGYLSAHDTYHVNGPGVYGVISREGASPISYRLTTTSSSDWTYNTDHGGLDKASADSRPHYMAIVLTDDVIHFQVSDDGAVWNTVRTVDRNSGMAGTPAKLIVGKGYYEAGTHPAADLDNDYSDPGPMVDVQITDLTIEPVSAADLKQAAVPGEYFRDVYGERELAKPGDPTFESVASHWPPLLYPRDAIGVANHPEEFSILPNGVIGAWPNHLLYPKNHDARRAWFVLGDEGHRFGGETTVTRKLAAGWLPILTCGYDHDGLKYEQTIAAWSEGMSADTPLIGLVRMTVRNEQKQSASSRLAFFAEHEKKDIAVWEKMTIPAGGEQTVWLEIDFPNGSDKPITGRKIDQGTYDKKTSEVSDAWTKLIGEGMQISVPEERIMNAWRAWQVWMLSDVDKVNGQLEFHDGGGGFYELVYGFSAARAAEMADQINRPSAARAWLEAMLSMGDKDGLHVINFGLPDQGSLMNAVVHHYRYSRDKEWLKKVAPSLLKMSQWSRNARVQAKAETPTTSPAYGMIKARPYCDHPDPGFYLISDVLLATGLQNVARALAGIGMEDDAKWIAAEGEAYAADLRDIIKKSVFTVDNMELLPLFPETKELLRATGWMASDYYSLCVTSLLESGGDILPHDSRYAQNIVESLEQRGGLLMGVSKFWGGIDHAYTAGYWANRLRHGEPEKALLGLYASMAYGMSQDTFASVEVTFAKDGKNFPTLPHNYSNLEQIRLVRNLLVDEVGDVVVLGSGIARHWLKQGESVEVKNAGTRWGTVSYRITSQIDSQKIQVTLSAPEEAPPGGIKIVLRHPDETLLKDVIVTGAEIAEKGNDYILLKNAAGDVKMEASY